MSSFLTYLITGISLGSIYALIALGYTMVYGIAKMLNFAHGDVIMIGGYVVFIAISTLYCPVWLAIAAGILSCTLLGVVIEKVAYKPLRTRAAAGRFDYGDRRQLSFAEFSFADFRFSGAQFYFRRSQVFSTDRQC